MSQPAFELEDVVKSYPLGERRVPVLRGIRLAIDAGESVAIMGPSGSGKSTLLTLLGCLELPTQGGLKVLGNDVRRLTDDALSTFRARELGFVFQAFHLLSGYDALSNVLLGAVYSGQRRPSRRAQALLQAMGLGHRLRHRPATLSGGEKQRVAIARALINDPKIILADEPTGALDQRTGGEILGLLDGLHRQGKTIIVVTHDPAVASRAGRVLEMVDGVIHRERTGRSLLK